VILIKSYYFPSPKGTYIAKYLLSPFGNKKLYPLFSTTSVKTISFFILKSSLLFKTLRYEKHQYLITNEKEFFLTGVCLQLNLTVLRIRFFADMK